MPANHPMQLGTNILPWHPTLRITSIMPGFDHQALVQHIATEMRDHLISRT
jgi:hypothetical protein